MLQRSATSRSVICTAACLCGIVAMCGGAAAQSSMTYSAGTQWGTTSSGVAVPGAYESSLAHGLNSANAAAVNAARKDVLVGAGAGGAAVTAIGSQSIINNTVIGNNNVNSINATQSASNTGQLSNSGQISSK